MALCCGANYTFYYFYMVGVFVLHVYIKYWVVKIPFLSTFKVGNQHCKILIEEDREEKYVMMCHIFFELFGELLTITSAEVTLKLLKYIGMRVRPKIVENMENLK